MNRNITDDDVECVMDKIQPNQDGKITIEELDDAIDKLKEEEEEEEEAEEEKAKKDSQEKAKKFAEKQEKKNEENN